MIVNNIFTNYCNVFYMELCLNNYPEIAINQGKAPCVLIGSQSGSKLHLYYGLCTGYSQIEVYVLSYKAMYDLTMGLSP